MWAEFDTLPHNQVRSEKIAISEYDKKGPNNSDSQTNAPEEPERHQIPMEKVLPHVVWLGNITESIQQPFLPVAKLLSCFRRSCPVLGAGKHTDSAGLWGCSFQVLGVDEPHL